MSIFFSNSTHKKVFDFWISKSGGNNINPPFLFFLTAGNVWEVFASFQNYFGSRNHFLFEEVLYGDKEYLIDKKGNYFTIKFNKIAKIKYPEFIKTISKDEILNLIKSSEINELPEYESMNSVNVIIENLLAGKCSY